MGSRLGGPPAGSVKRLGGIAECSVGGPPQVALAPIRATFRADSDGSSLRGRPQGSASPHPPPRFPSSPRLISSPYLVASSWFRSPFNHVSTVASTLALIPGPRTPRRGAKRGARSFAPDALPRLRKPVSSRSDLQRRPTPVASIGAGGHARGYGGSP